MAFWHFIGRRPEKIPCCHHRSFLLPASFTRLMRKRTAPTLHHFLHINVGSYMTLVERPCVATGYNAYKFSYSTSFLWNIILVHMRRYHYSFTIKTVFFLFLYPLSASHPSMAYMAPNPAYPSQSHRQPHTSNLKHITEYLCIH